MAQVTHSGLPRPEGIIEADTVLDIGAGIRPMGWYKPQRHICVEPHGPYADALEAAGYEVLRRTARAALETDAQIDAIYMLDVIEHMERAEGERVLMLAQMHDAQIVVATPNGYLPQEGDAWDMGGEHWQKHRSGWVPADFPGWRISFYDNGTKQRGFVAVNR